MWVKILEGGTYFSCREWVVLAQFGFEYHVIPLYWRWIQSGIWLLVLESILRLGHQIDICVMQE